MLPPLSKAGSLPAHLPFATPSRRGFLAGLFGSILGLSMPVGQARAEPSRDGTRLDVLAPRIDPVISIINVHTDERLINLRYYDRIQGYDVRAIQAIDHIMRDWRENAVMGVDERIIWGLTALTNAARADGHDGVIYLNSGYRTRKTNAKLENAAQNSMHLQAKAADFTFKGVSPRIVSTYAQWLQIGGVGYYPGQFTHVDSGPIRSW